MSKAAPSPKINLAAPQTIPLDKLSVHEANVRQIKSGVSIESLAADIARRGLLQSLSVRPILDDAGEETGQYGVQAGGRRLRALQSLVKQKKLAKNAPVPCIVRNEGFVEADSLAENTEREALHPLDQFRAFAALRDKGEGEETIAAAFGVTPAVVKQRLRLANASPQLLKAYENDEIKLDQLMAFCLVDDHKRQDEVFAAIKSHWNKGPEAIRRLLTEKTVRADDPRALFIGAEAYKAAGGIIIRDLFDEDDGGYLQDVPLLEKLVHETLAAEAEMIRAEGWGWVEAAIDFPWNHQRDFRRLKPLAPALSDEEREKFEALSAEYDELASLEEDENSESATSRMNELLALLALYENKSPVFDKESMQKAGAFVSLSENGFARIERGYIRREDEAAAPLTNDDGSAFADADGDCDTFESDVTHAAAVDEDGSAALPDRLMIELTAYRSLALRDAIAKDHAHAYLAVLHALTLQLFYHFSGHSCLQISAKDLLTSPFPGLTEFTAAKAIEARHKEWQATLPEREGDLWDYLVALDHDRREALFAHCAGLTINAVHEPHARVSHRMRHGDQLATALALDMAKAGWVTGAENYLNRVTKAQIIEAVREAKGDKTVELIADLKKKEMAQGAERLLAGTGWLPECLRTSVALDEPPVAPLPAFLDEPQLQAAE
ncbi:MAG: ParB/RepB/Spo0J family partition protein [Rhodomicrobiaceae bacterium]